MGFRTRIGLVVGFAILACSVVRAQDVTRDWDKAYDFTKVKTFAIKIGTSWGNQLSEKRVLTDISEALADKGWTATASESDANLLVVVHGATEVKHTIHTFYDGWGGGWGYYGGGMSSGMGTTTVSDYLVGTLVVDMFDPKTKNLLFRGTATAEISKDPTKNEKKSDKAAQKIFKDFPVKDKK